MTNYHLNLYLLKNIISLELISGKISIPAWGDIFQRKTLGTTCMKRDLLPPTIIHTLIPFEWHALTLQ